MKRLNEIADRGAYGPSPAELQLDVQAIVIATDFFQIATVLPTQLAEHIAVELARALEGKLEATPKSRVAETFLSQFWFALVLARGGISPRIPKPQVSSTPDYVVSVDTLDYAIEVKRPESLHSAPDAMDLGASQIRDFDKPSLIAMDLTDALFLPANRLRFRRWSDSPGSSLCLVPQPRGRQAADEHQGASNVDRGSGRIRRTVSTVLRRVVGNARRCSALSRVLCRLLLRHSPQHGAGATEGQTVQSPSDRIRCAPVVPEAAVLAEGGPVSESDNIATGWHERHRPQALADLALDSRVRERFGARDRVALLTAFHFETTRPCRQTSAPASPFWAVDQIAREGIRRRSRAEIVVST